jgi:hypothetical protein
MPVFRIRQSPSGKFINIPVPDVTGGQFDVVFVTTTPFVAPPLTNARTLFVVKLAEGDGDFTLPRIATLALAGLEVAVKNFSGGGSTITIHPFAGDVIDNSITSEAISNGQSAIYVSDNTDDIWFHI